MSEQIDGLEESCLDSLCMLLQTWDVNKAASESLGGPFNLILASNAVHTCDNMAGRYLFCYPILLLYFSISEGLSQQDAVSSELHGELQGDTLYSEILSLLCLTLRRPC